MQLNDSLEQFQEQGLAITGISYDSVATVRHFSERVGIQYPLLADPDAANIQAFGVVNTRVSPERRNHGIPFPGIYIIDENGVLGMEGSLTTGIKNGKERTVKLPFSPTYKLQVEAFGRHITSRAPYPLAPEDGLANVQLISQARGW